MLRIAIKTITLTISVAAAALAQGPHNFQNSSRTYGTRPALFVPNKGQAPADVLWQAIGKGFEASFSRDGFALRLQKTAPQAGQDSPRGATAANGGTGRAVQPARSVEQRISFVGANAQVRIEALDPQPGKISFFRGRDPKNWASGLSTYSRLRYANLYPGIDLLFYAKAGSLEYDFVVAPGADPGLIRMRVEDGRAVHITRHGELQLGEGTDAILHRPLLYQNIKNGKRVVEGEFIRLDNQTVGFQFKTYDRTKTLVIDPTLSLLYSTYLGGPHDDEAQAIALDAQSNTYIVGFSASQDYPVSANAYQPNRQNIGQVVTNMVITKFNSSGIMLYSTFLGGSTDDGSSSNASGIVLDVNGNAYITSVTKSTDFPVTGNAYQATFPSGASTSAFLSEISPDGSALLYSSFFGGSGGASGSGIGLNPQGYLVVAGTAGTGLPTTSQAYLNQISSGTAAFVAVFNLALSGTAQLIASTYYGSSAPALNYSGTGNIALAMALDSSGNPWIAGQSYTNNLPTSGNAYQPSVPALNPICGGGALNSVAYFAKLSADLSKLDYASYLSGKTAGSTCSEYAHAIVLDGSGNVYVGGTTSSSAFPTTNGVFQQTYAAAGYSEFISKVSPDGTQLLWSTYLGANGGYSFQDALALDSQNNVWVSGTTQGGSNFPLQNAYQATEGGGYDGHVTQIKSDGTQVLYSTYLGGSGDDVAGAVAVDAQNNVYVAGITNSRNFPVTTNAFQPVFANGDPVYDGNDVFFAILGTGVIGPVTPASAGNVGDATITIGGAGFGTGSTCALAMGATTIQASMIAVSSSGTSITCTFALNGATPGAYTVSVTNASGGTLVEPNAFTVTSGAIGPQVWVDIAGRSSVRFGVPQTFFITYGNSGDTNALFSTIFIQMPTDVQFTYTAVHPPTLPGGDVDFSQIPQTTVLDGMNTAAVVIPLLAPGVTATFAVQVTAPNDPTTDFDIVAYTTTAPLGTSITGLQSSANPNLRPLFTAIADTVALHPNASTAGACMQDLLGALFASLPGFSTLGCAGGVISFLAGYIAQSGDSVANGTVTAPVNWADMAGQLAASAGAPCLNAALGSNPATAWIALAGALYNAYLAYQNCQQYFQPLLPKPKKPTKKVKGQDPNEKDGPSGDNSTSAYVTGSKPLSYSIGFENEATATAPAAQVVITDQLDPTKVNLTTLSLGSIFFGTNVITLPSGVNNYSTTYSLSSSLSVRIQGSLNTDTGLLKWTFTSIDPSTGLPPSDPTVGFLPPDVDGVEGQGGVAFTVLPKSALSTGTQITNQATVVFDANAPINTATWLNTIDVTPPVSSVQALSATESKTCFNVAWSGSDVGSGIVLYNIYVSDNGGPFTLWQTSTSAGSATYTGQPSHTYGFYTIATDGVGNMETKTVADTTTKVKANAGGCGANPTTTTITVSPDPAVYDQPVTITATVKNGTATPPNSGNVTFMAGFVTLGVVTLSNGQASYTTTVGQLQAVEQYHITASFGGNGQNAASSPSKSVDLLVNPATTTTVLTSSVNPGVPHESVTFTATVLPAFQGTPTGTVTFYNGSRVLQTVSLVNGVATHSTTTLAAGAQKIKATYNGSRGFTISSGSLTEEIY